MKVLLSVQSVAPAYGGLAVMVSRMAFAMADAGALVGLWAPDASTMHSPLMQRVHSRVRTFGGCLLKSLECFGLPDVIHDNGIWMPCNHAISTIARRRRIPRLVSLHGMLLPNAVKIRVWKKKIAWQMYQRRDLLSSQCIHATSDAEAQCIREHNLGVNVQVVPNGIDLPLVSVKASLTGRETRGPRNALFLGRLHPIKGLPMLIDAWSRVRPEGWTLQIAGTDEDGHRGELETMVQSNGLVDRIKFLGEVGIEQKVSVFANADLFILPTHSENFGLVVAEALAHEVPVITTKNAPWEALRRHRCGWWIDLSDSALMSALHEATSLSDAERAAMGVRGRAWMARDFTWPAVAKQMHGVYTWVLDGGPPPACALTD